MSKDNALLGKASLLTAIIGPVLPVCILFATFGGPNHLLGRDLSLGLFVILELVALGCGIAARRTGIGIAGMFISLTLLLLLWACIIINNTPFSIPGLQITP
jgi:hypothetical protein